MSSFGFHSAGHFFAAAFSDLKSGLKFVEKAIPTVQADMPEVEALTSLAGAAGVPGANADVLIERAADAALGEILAAVNAADDAAAQNGLNVTLDAAVVADFRALIAAAKPALLKLGFQL